MNNKPFLLKPAAKDYLWGGSRLNDDFGKSIDLYPLAESWECSVHADGQSTVAESGEALGEVIKAHPEYLGAHAAKVGDGQLPIMIKLVDAKEDLSVQVHPDDAYAKEHESDNGKTEMWYVLDARPGAELIYGFNRDMEELRVREALEKGTIGKYLNHVPINKDDVFVIEPGTIHALGAGALVAEIQESSNITYRLYDYDRVGKDGRKRELHVDKALDVVKLSASVAPRQPMRVLKYRNGCASELLARCRYFQVERMLLNTEIHRELVTFQTDVNSFHALLCVSGCGMMYGADLMIPFFKGDCIFVPAESIPIKLHGKAQLLNVSC